MIRSSIQQGIILLALSAIFAFGYNALRSDRLPLIATKKVLEKADAEEIESIIQDTKEEISPILKEIDLEIAKKLWDKGITFVDARSEEDYKKGHIAGAVYMSVIELAQNYSLDDPIVTYCEGVGCEASIIMGESLIDWGFLKVYIFHGGWPEWKNAGYPIESSTITQNTYEKFDMYSLPTRLEFEIYQETWRMFRDAPPGEKWEKEVIDLIAKKYTTTSEHVDKIYIKLQYYNNIQNSSTGKAVEDMNWQEFQELIKKVGPPWPKQRNNLE